MRIGIDIMDGDRSPGSAAEESHHVSEFRQANGRVIFPGSIARLCIYALHDEPVLSRYEIVPTENTFCEGYPHPKSLSARPEPSVNTVQIQLTSSETDAFYWDGNKNSMITDFVSILNTPPGVPQSLSILFSSMEGCSDNFEMFNFENPGGAPDLGINVPRDRAWVNKDYCHKKQDTVNGSGD